MKLRIRNPSLGAMTVFEVMVVLACFLILVAIVLQILVPVNRGTQRINCVSNLRQINIAFRIWEGDNLNQYPMTVSVTNGGAKELMETGNLTACLQLASNEMTTTKIFVCADDPARTFATNWNDLNRSHVSYFLGADASSDTNSEMIFSGDDNLVVSGVPVGSGLVNLSSNASLSWSGTRHRFCGNIGFADGSVSQTTSNSLQQAFQGTGLATNRIVIP
jgi:prepilin-type processing-associated H-X9-DG protein